MKEQPEEELFNIFRKFKEVTDSQLSFEEFKELNRAYQKQKMRQRRKNQPSDKFFRKAPEDWGYKPAEINKKKKSSNKKAESPQRQINEALDKIVFLQAEITKYKDDAEMIKSLEDALINQKNKINNITNDGTQIKGLFNNPYYVGHTDPSKFNV